MRHTSVELPNLADLTFSQMLSLAYDLSVLTYEDIAEQMGKGTTTIRRYFTDPTYNPPLYLVPKLCKVLGNDLLIEWLCIHAGGLYLPALRIETSDAELDIMIAELIKEFSDVLSEDGKARLDGKRDGRELSQIEKQLVEMLKIGYQVKRLVQERRRNESGA